jgi:hypothetical protein
MLRRLRRQGCCNVVGLRPRPDPRVRGDGGGPYANIPLSCAMCSVQVKYD